MSKSKAKFDLALHVFVGTAYITGPKGEQAKVESGTTAKDAGLAVEQAERYLAKGLLDHVDNVVSTAGKTSGELRAEVTALTAEVNTLKAQALKDERLLEILSDTAPEAVEAAEAQVAAELEAAAE